MTSPVPSVSSHALVPAPTTTTTSSSTVSPSAAAVQRNIHYEAGIAAQPPPTVHTIQVGCYSSEWCDYYKHRRPNAGEVLGQSTFWLHNAKPRDRFVFLLTPVEGGIPVLSPWHKVYQFLYGKAPLFALPWREHEEAKNFLGRIFRPRTKKKHGRSMSIGGGGGGPSSSKPSSRLGTPKNSSMAGPTPTPPPVTPLRTPQPSSNFMGEQQNPSMASASSNTNTATPSPLSGVEVVEVLHKDITAMDYAPGLLTSRLAVETALVTTTWFPSVQAALDHYGCSSLPQQHAGGNPLSTSNCLTPAAGFAPPTPWNPVVRGTGLSRPPSPMMRPASAAESPSKPPQRPDGEPEVCVPPPRNTTLPPLDLDGGEACGSGGPTRETESPLISLTEASVRASDPESRRQMLEAGLPLDNDNDANSSLPPSTNRTTVIQRQSRFTFPENPIEESSRDASPLTSLQQDPPPTRGEPRTQKNTVVTVWTQDPHFNACLREVLFPDDMSVVEYCENRQSQKRLMHMYEAGMPSWCIFFARKGLPYRRTYRLTVVALINLWPMLALVIGLYDLYKHMPYVRQYMEPFFEWMDAHLTFRFSFMIAYVVTISLTFVQGIFLQVKSMLAIFAFVLKPIQPLLELAALIQYPFQWLATLGWSTVKGFGLLLYQLVFILASPIRILLMTVHAIFAPVAAVAQPASAGVQSASAFMRTMQQWLVFWQQVLRPVKNLLKACYDGIVHVGVAIARREASLRVWYFARLAEVWFLIEMLIRWSFTKRGILFWSTLIALFAVGSVWWFA